MTMIMMTPRSIFTVKISRWIAVAKRSDRTSRDRALHRDIALLLRVEPVAQSRFSSAKITRDDNTILSPEYRMHFKLAASKRRSRSYIHHEWIIFDGHKKTGAFCIHRNSQTNNIIWAVSHNSWTKIPSFANCRLGRYLYRTILSSFLILF